MRRASGRRRWAAVVLAGWALVLLATAGKGAAEMPVTSAEALTGYAVRGPGGEAVGTVQTVLFDLRAGRIGYLMVLPLDRNGSEGVVPWRAVRVEPQNRSVILRVETNRFRRAPFAENDVRDPERAGAIHDYYGVSPNWEAPRAPSAPRGLRVVR